MTQPPNPPEEPLGGALTPEPEDASALILLGDFYLGKDMEVPALAAYDEALERAASNSVKAGLLNNTAWLLLTAKTPGMRDRERALRLAEQAVDLADNTFILDTLATAYWAHGRIDKALALEEKAAQLDPENSTYYQEQMDRFRSQQWQPRP